MAQLTGTYRQVSLSVVTHCVLTCFCQISVTNLFHYTNASQCVEAITSFSNLEALYAAFFRLLPDGHRSRLPSFLHGGWAFFAVAAG